MMATDPVGALESDVNSLAKAFLPRRELASYLWRLEACDQSRGTLQQPGPPAFTLTGFAGTFPSPLPLLPQM